MSLPTVVITGPTSAATYTSYATPLVLSGTAASGTSALAAVDWANAASGSGVAAGTATWSASVPLVSGSNVITTTAVDVVSGTGTDVITVTYKASNVTLTLDGTLWMALTPQAGVEGTWDVTINGSVIAGTLAAATTAVLTAHVDTSVARYLNFKNGAGTFITTVEIAAASTVDTVTTNAHIQLMPMVQFLKQCLFTTSNTPVTATFNKVPVAAAKIGFGGGGF